MEENKSKNAWLMSFADLLSLILSFFVMMYATQEIPNDKWKDYNKEISSYVNGNNKSWSFGMSKKSEKKLENKEINNNYTHDYIYNGLRNIIMDSGFNPDGKEIEIITDNNEVIIKFKKPTNLDGYFLKNKVDISDSYGKLFDAMTKFLNVNKNQLEINGYVVDKNNENLSNLIIGKLFEFGYEYRILKGVGEEGLQTDNLSIVIKSYEAFD